MAPTVAEPELFRAMPGTADVFAWMPLGTFPTALERIDGVLPTSVELWVKREDLSAEAYGGGKIRKLEFLFGDARARHKRRLATFGGTGSHHVTASAIHGARAGFDVEATLFRQPDDDHVRELLKADRRAGARITVTRNLTGVIRPMLAARIRNDTAWLAGGGSSPLGTLGWVSGALELRAQVRAGLMPPPDIVYAAMGSCGMVAGLLCGLRSSRPPDVAAVRVVPGPFCGQLAALRLARAVERMLEPFGPVTGEPPRLRVEERFLGDGYGHATPESREAVRLFAAHDLALDAIYTGKVMAALLDDARAGRLRGKRVLFIHSYSHDGWRRTPE